MKRCWVILLILSSLCDMGRAQVLTTAGDDFWLTFLPNHRRGVLSLFMSGDVATTGTVSAGGGSWTQTFTVTPGTVTTVSVPNTFELDPHQLRILNCGVHVTTDTNISLYASNYLQASYDNTNVLPTNTLRNHYVLQTVDSAGWDNTFGVVAPEDSTMVYYKLSAYNRDSNRMPGVTYSVLLNQGQCYMVRSPHDLSGTEVWTEDCRKIAVFTGNMCAYVPVDCGACDYLVEQSIPTEYWGRRFGVTTSKLRTSDMLKITALKDNTLVRYENNTFSLQAHESRMLNIIRPTDDGGFFLEGSKPLSLFLYLKGSECAGNQGDPSCTVIHPIEQQIPYITFSTFRTDRINAHYVNLVTRDIYSGFVYLDDNIVSSSYIQVLRGNSEYRYARIPVTDGSHTLRLPVGGLVAHVYGLGQVESYSYAVGATLDPINPYSFLNDLPFMLYNSNNNVFCLNDVLNFRAEVVDEENTDIVWDFGDGDTATGFSVSHSYQRPGNYTVTVDYTHYSDCYGPTYHTHTVDIYIHEQPIGVTDTVVCDSVCSWNGHRYDTVGQYSVLFSSDEFCDSVAKLNILALFTPPKPVVSYDYDCDEHRCRLHVSGDGDYFRWNSTPYNAELNGHETDTLLMVTTDVARTYNVYMTSREYPQCGADTSFVIPQIDIFKALISATPAIVDLDHTTVWLADVTPASASRVWYVDGNEIGRSQKVAYDYPVSRDSVIVTLAATSIYGCHDTTELALRLMTDGIYVPNVITPSRGDNNYFQVIGNSLMDGEIWIFDRRGAQVWYSNDIHACWDATHDGTPLPQGTYVYTLRYRQILEPEVWLRKMGTVTVVR